MIPADCFPLSVLTRDQTVKYFFYTILLVASLGTVGAIMNPALVQQGAALIGLELPQNSANPVEKPSSEDQLAKFLAQYPFAGSQNSTAIPSSTVPIAAVSEPASSPISPFHAAPATPFPVPVIETAAPIYANPVQPPASWDSEATTPIYPPPVIEYHLPPAPVADWSGPSQPYQEPAPAPQHSIYAIAPFFNHPHPNTPVVSAPQEVCPAIENTVPPGFAQTLYVPPQQTHLPQPPPPPAANVMPQTSAVLIEEVPVHGTETVARVGTQVILMGDILPKIRRTTLKIVDEKLKQMSEEKRAEVTREEIEEVTNAIATNLYPEVLQEQLLFALVYSDYLSQQGREQRAMFNERLGEEFDRKEVPEMLKEFNVENVAALKRYLEQQLGSSLEKEKKLWIQEQIVRQWISMSIERGTAAATHDEMMDFYERNQAMFTTTARARWQEMTVLFSRHNTEREAESKIRWMGNQVATGSASFEEIARTKSEGFTASDGGVRDWTTRGSLTSVELEQAIFSQPINQLSPAIIRSDRGLHIIRVLEREEAEVIPFVEAQVTIRDRIRNQRTQRHQDEYLADLRRRYPTVVARERIDFDINNTRTASSAW